MAGVGLYEDHGYITNLYIISYTCISSLISSINDISFAQYGVLLKGITKSPDSETNGDKDELNIVLYVTNTPTCSQTNYVSKKYNKI